MLRRLCAISLVILAAVPFTAPFATLDWSDFIGGKQSCNVLELAAPVVSSHHDDADDAASVALQRVRPMGLSALAPAAWPAAGGALTSAAAIFVPASSDPPRLESSTLPAVLRV